MACLLTETLKRETLVSNFFTKKFACYLKAAMGRLYLCSVNEDEKSALLKGRKNSLVGRKTL